MWIIFIIPLLEITMSISTYYVDALENINYNFWIPLLYSNCLFSINEISAMNIEEK